MADTPRLRRSIAFTTAGIAAAALGLLAAAPARACSEATGTLLPTNYELVRRAEAVVLARAVRFSPSPEHPEFGQLTFEVEEVLAGDFRDASLTLDANLDAFAGRTPEDDFSAARPTAAACIAEDYRLHGRYLLFLRQYSRRWDLSGLGFSRINEEVNGPDSPWVQVVRRYLSVAALHDYEREKVALRRLRARAAAGKEPNVLAGALAADVDRHFRTPSDAKSGPDLVALFLAAPSERLRLDALWALAHTAPPEVKGFMRRALLQETRPDWLQPLGSYFAKVEDHAAFATLAALWDRCPPDGAQRSAVRDALPAAAGPGDAKRMLELLHGSSASEAASVALWFARPGRDPRPAIADLHGRIPRGDYGRDLYLTMALAAVGDAAVVEWAEQAVNPASPAAGSATAADAGGPARSARAAADDRDVAAYVLAVSPLAAADGAARELVAAGDPRLIDELIGAYSFHLARFNPRRWHLLEEILRVQGANSAVMSTLERELESLRDVGSREDQVMAAPLLARVQDVASNLPGLK